MARRIHASSSSSPYSSAPNSGDSLYQYHDHYLPPRHEEKKRPNLMVTALATLVFLMAVFIFKIHVVDLPHIEANHYPPKDSHPHIKQNSMNLHLDKLFEDAEEKWRGDTKNIWIGGKKVGDDDNFESRNITHRTEGDPEKLPIFNILEQAGFDTINDPRFDDAMLNKLPKWSEVKEMYGEPKVLGLETCEYYRQDVDPKKWRLAVAGNFNSGTNFLYELLRKNCEKPPLWQVPWGKHYPAYFRETNQVSKMKDVHYSDVMPVVMVRDPYTWMQSQCRQPYNARFDHNKSTCPNIIPYPTDILDHPRYAKMKYVPIHLTYSKEPFLKYKHPSLAHFWNSWNNEYLYNRTSEFPRLIVRMEDLVFHGEKVVPQICACAGMETKGKFHHKRNVANWNNGIDKNVTHGAGLLQSIIRYGTPATKLKGYTPCQLWAAKDILDPRLMSAFGYNYVEKFGDDPSEWEDCFGYLQKR